MGEILSFPGSYKPPRAIASVEDLPHDAKAIVIVRDGDGYAATMRPALNDRELAVREHFGSKAEAMAFAQRKAWNYPRLYRLVLDETGEPGGGRAS